MLDNVPQLSNYQWAIMPEYKQAQETCKKVDGDPTKANNPYKARTLKNHAWRIGWNKYYDKKWDEQFK